MPTYAAKTSVSVDRSRAEIEHLLERFGAGSFVSGWDKATNQHVIMFELRGRRMRLRLALPDPSAPEIVYKRLNQSAYRERRTPAQARAAWDQACAERWRALVLLIKAKLAAVEAGIAELDDEFLASMLLPDQRTIREWLAPQLDRLADHMPPLLPMPEEQP